MPLGGAIVFVIAFLKRWRSCRWCARMTILLTIGALIGAAHIPFVPVWIVSAWRGAGDWVSYAIGCRLKQRRGMSGR